MAKILIIDDDDHVVGVLKTYLMEQGHQVLTASTGTQGLAEAKKVKPDLIMLDVMLPDATGFQLCKEIRRAPSMQAIPIIMMSGVARYPNQKVFGLERGANEYILKPFELVQVGDMVETYLRSDAMPRKREVEKTTPPPNDVGHISDLKSYIEKTMHRFRM